MIGAQTAVGVYKRHKGKRVLPGSKGYDQGTWYVYRRIRGSKTIHRSIPEARTRQQAELAERRLVEAAFNRRYGVGDSTSFREFADGPYTRYCEQNNVNIGAKRLYIRMLVKEFRGDILSEITPQRCRDVQARIRAKASSASSVNRIMSTLSKLFTLACQEGILDRNPMQFVKMLKEPPPRRRLLTIEEKERLWEELEKDTLLKRLVTLATNLPLRRAQLLAITPDAIDTQTGSLLISPSKGRAARLIPLNNTAAVTLSRMLADHQLPFPLKDFRKRWHRALIAAGINKPGGKRGENFTFHDLRREMASSLIRQNVNPEVVQKLFAHSAMNITQVYMASTMEDLTEAVKRLDDNIQESEGVQ
jgi:integrase/recombinase XerC